MYVLYKVNNLPNVGGVHPQGIEVGLAYYKGWNLANCPENKAHYYKEFDFVPVPSNIAYGLQVLDRLVVEDVEIDADNKLAGRLGAPASADIKYELSEMDETNKAAAEKFINNLELKLITRAKVREIKDVEDDLVDMKKVVQGLLTFVIDDWRVKSAVEKDKSMYKAVLNDLDAAVAENIGALSTIHDDLQKIEKVVDLEVSIAKVVDEYYLTKKL